MKETIAIFILALAGVLTIGYLVIRPLIAIGDIPGEIRKLRESIDDLSKIIEKRGEQK